MLPRLILVSHLVCITAGIATSQINMTASAGNTWTASVGSIEDTLAAGTDITNGGSVSAAGTPGCGSASTSFTNMALSPGEPRGRLASLAGFGSTFFCAGAGDTGDNILSVILTTPSPTYVELTLETLIINPATSDARVVIPSIGVDEPLTNPFSGPFVPTPETYTFLVDPNGTEFRLSTSATTSSDQGGNVAVSFEVAPAILALESLPVGCGPRLFASRLPAGPGLLGTVRLTASLAPLWEAHFIILGTQELSVPIAPLGCVLGTDILAAIPIAQPSPTTILSLPIPDTTGLPEARFQYLSGRTLPSGIAEWATSDVIRVIIP